MTGNLTIGVDIDQITDELTKQFMHKIAKEHQKIVKTEANRYKEAQYLNQKEASRYLGISVAKFQELKALGLHASNINGMKLYSKKSIDTLMEQLQED